MTMNPKMKLLSAPTSPYGRKAKMTLIIKGFMDQTEVLDTDTLAINPTLNAANPLAKIPCLITQDGESLYDSHVICEYLDSIGPGPVLFPGAGMQRWRTLRLAALADGVMDAALLMVYEGRFRAPEMKVQSWLERQQRKVDQSIDFLETQDLGWSVHPDYGQLSVAAALGYLDLRQAGAWRKAHPKLVAFHDAFAAAVPAFAKTKPPVA